MNIAKVSSELKQALQPLYGDRFSHLLLYGSYARQDFTEESDLDFMLVLNNEDINPHKEIGRANPLLCR